MLWVEREAGLILGRREEKRREGKGRTDVTRVGCVGNLNFYGISERFVCWRHNAQVIA
jgi:hypothetical protein